MLVVIAALLAATPLPRDARYEIQVRNLQKAEFTVRGCALRATDRMLQWFDTSGVPTGPAVYLPAAALQKRSTVSIVAAGAYAFAVVHANGKVLAKTSGTCAGDPIPPPRGARVFDICKEFKAPAAYFTGVASSEVFELGDGRARLDLATAARLACAGEPATAVTSDLPWSHEDLGFHVARAKFIADGSLTEGYSSPEMVEARLQALARKYPGSTRLETIATSHQGRPVYALAVGEGVLDNDPRPTLLLDGAHHGDELLSTSVVLDAARVILEDPKLADIRRSFVVWCVPLVNPDGLAMFLDTSIRAGRKNGRDADNDGQRGIHDGVDLNRNYPFGWRATASAGPEGDKPLSRTYPGPSAGSEPETQGMMRLAERESFVAALSFHMGTTALLVPYTVSTALDPQPDEALAIAHAIAGKLPVKDKLYEVDGTDQDWHRWKNGTLAYVAEIANWPPPLDTPGQRALIEPTRALWIRLARRFIQGPSLQTRDATKVPAQTFHNGEQWLPRQRDGLVSRFLVSPAR